MEEFSFPAVAAEQDSLGRLLPFPASPLWFPASSAVGACRTKVSGGAPGEEEEEEAAEAERMDVLWESFNEELRRLSCEHEREAAATTAAEEAPCCLRVLSESRIDRPRRVSLLLLLKVFKKLFLFHG